MAFLTELLAGTAGDVTVSIYEALIISDTNTAPPPHPPPVFILDHNQAVSFFAVSFLFMSRTVFPLALVRVVEPCVKRQTVCEDQVNETRYKLWESFQTLGIAVAEADAGAVWINSAGTEPLPRSADVDAFFM